MKRLIIGLAVLVILSFGTIQFVQAAIRLNDGGVHNISTNISESVVVGKGSEGPTTLNVLSSGSVSVVNPVDWRSAVYSYEGSTINVLGGTIRSVDSSFPYAHGLAAYERSTINVTDGLVEGRGGQHSTGIIANNSTVNISGGTVLGSTEGSSGTFGVLAYNSTTVNITDGTIQGTRYGIGAYSLSRYIITGGEIIVSDGVGLAIIASGGSVSIYGTGFNYPDGPIPISENYETLNGTLENGDSISWRFFTGPAGGEIILNGASTIIPEPTTLIIWSLLSVLAITVGWWQRRRAS